MQHCAFTVMFFARLEQCRVILEEKNVSISLCFLPTVLQLPDSYSTTTIETKKKKNFIQTIHEQTRGERSRDTEWKPEAQVVLIVLKLLQLTANWVVTVLNFNLSCALTGTSSEKIFW